MEDPKGAMKITLNPNLSGDPDYIATNATGRGVWLQLLLWCAEQENGGVIPGAATWSDEAWGMLGVSKNSLAYACRLVTFRSPDVVLWGYPIEQEKILQAKRSGGKKGADARYVNKSRTPNGTPNGTPTKSPLIEPTRKPVLSNEEWLAGIKVDPAFRLLDVDKERFKATRWCQENNRQLTRKFFINWLNKADKPLPANGHSQQTYSRPIRS
jgi:hypothetical protein